MMNLPDLKVTNLKNITKISAFIIAKNEASRIATAIKSLQKIADEIIVVDSGSTDDTTSIAQQLGAKVFFNEWPGYTAQKVYAQELCKHPWILNLDADEELSPALQDEIKFIFESSIEERFVAYEFKLIILHRNDQKPRLFAPSNIFIRLYNRNYGGFSNTKSSTHDCVVISEASSKKVYLLNEVAYHRSGASIEQLVQKSNFYSSEQAKDFVRAKRSIVGLRLILEMFFWFLKAFFIRRYFVFGLDGFIDSIIFAFARFLKLAKARELIKHSSSSQNKS